VNDQETEKSALCSKSGSKLPNGSKEEEGIEYIRNLLFDPHKYIKMNAMNM
jgi:hypothetical protein